MPPVRRSWLRRLRDLVAGWSAPPADTRALGRYGERLAARHLRAAGYRILARNVVTPVGEADIVALDPDGRTVVVVEVKARRANVSSGGVATPPPERSITAHKRDKVTQVARHLAQANGWTDRAVRMDVVAVELVAGERRPQIRHHLGAIAPDRSRQR